MTPEQARELFSAAFDQELDEAQQRAFDAALAADEALLREYRAFVDMLELARGGRELAGGKSAAARAERPAPDLLPGVQRKLRARSRGRFYGDRFAERLGSGLLAPLPLALFMLALLAIAWLAVFMLNGVSPTR